MTRTRQRLAYTFALSSICASTIAVYSKAQSSPTTSVGAVKKNAQAPIGATTEEAPDYRQDNRSTDLWRVPRELARPFLRSYVNFGDHGVDQ